MQACAQCQVTETPQEAPKTGGRLSAQIHDARNNRAETAFKVKIETIESHTVHSFKLCACVLPPQ